MAVLTFTDTKVQIDGVETQVYTAGDGEALLWFHGARGNNGILPIFEELAKAYKVFLVDHPGFGKSERIEDRFEDFEDYNYFYREFLDHFSLEKVHLVGHSLGGRMALEFAISHPHRVDKLVLISPSGLLVDGVKRTDLFILQPEERAQFFFHDQKWAEAILSSEKTDEEQNIEVKNLTQTVRLIWEKDYNPKFPALLRYIPMPTCIIWGKNDSLYPVEHGNVYAEHIRNAELHVLDQCGHVPQVEQAEQCVAIIKNFLNK